MTANANPLFKVADVVPHTGQMILIDAITAWHEAALTASLTLHHTSLFASSRGVPAWIGIEYMAQAIAALDGCRNRVRGKPGNLGLLLGSRKYESQCHYFPLEQTLSIQAQEVVRGSNGMCVYDCRIESAQQLLAASRVNVFIPTDTEAFKRGELV